MGAPGRALGMKSKTLAGEVVLEIVYSCGVVVGPGVMILRGFQGIRISGSGKTVECQGLGLGNGFQGH